MHRVGLVLILTILCETPALAQAPTDSDVRRILSERIDKYHDSVGMVVGIIDPSGRRVVSHGTFGANDARPVDGGTIFEIGSITKVFTSLILATMVERGEVALSDPVAKYLPGNVKVPQRKGRQITLRDLATHRSGLPRTPSNYSEQGPDDPYAMYSEEKLYAFLSGHELTRDVGSRFEYSNLGVAILGLALKRRAGMDYDTLVRERVLTPLGMTSTAFILNPGQETRLAVGHSNLYWMTPSPSWNLSTFDGAGGLRSTANDMLTFLAANLGMIETPLAPAIAAMLKDRRDVGDNDKVGLGWFVRKERGSESVWHNGGTFGYKSFAGYDPKKRLGVVVLSNNSSGAGVTDIGRHLLNSRESLNTLAVRKREVLPVDPQLLKSYVGRYEFPNKDVWTVRQDGERLFVTKPEAPEFEIFAQGDHRFILKTADSQITFEFEKASPDRASEMVLRQVWQNRPLRGKRID